jgi:hypothetical protein
MVFDSTGSEKDVKRLGVLSPPKWKRPSGAKSTHWVLPRDPRDYSSSGGLMTLWKSLPVAIIVVRDHINVPLAYLKLARAQSAITIRPIEPLQGGCAQGF